MVARPSIDETFRRLFAAHHRDLHAYCLRRLPVDDANEAVADIFLTAWRRMEQIPTGDETRLWLYGVARNVVRNWQRGDRRRLRLAAKMGSLTSPPAEPPEVHVIRSEEHQQVVDAISTLREHDQEVIRLKIWEGLSNAEVGSVLGITDKAVEARYTRSIKKLHKQLAATTAAIPSSPFSSERGEAAS